MSRLAYQIAGGSRAFYALDKEERARIRGVAHYMHDVGADFATSEIAEKVDKRGFLYVIRNPAWPAHVKVGRAFDPEARLRNYQTGCPDRNYKLCYAVYFEDCHAAEKLVHDTLADYQAQGEWYRILPSTAEHVLDQIGGYL